VYISFPCHWHGNIEIEFTINGIKKKAPMHILIEFGEDYPQSAPKVGFCTEFPFHDGATMIASSGKLYGLFVLCLNILGNFDFVHTEWKK
jgi:ubiquitin-protein ligase